jgi:hypothetical protein
MKTGSIRMWWPIGRRLTHSWRPGVDVEIRVTSVFHFRAGRQVERWLYPEDMAAWDAIFDG